MAVNGIHYLIYEKARDRYNAVQVELVKARERLNEAIALGDLRENSEYDAAKDTVGRLVWESEELQAVMSKGQVHASTDIDLIQEGSVIELAVYVLTKSPVRPGSTDFEELKSNPPVFRGVLAYGATLGYHELLRDSVLKIDTPVGKFLLGKRSGDYSVPVRDGFSNISVQKLSGEITTADLYCKVGGKVSEASG